MLPHDIEALAKSLAPMVAEQVVARLGLSPVSPSQAVPAIRQMLTVDQFAAAISRSPELVRRKIRGQVIPRKDVSGPPYLIHPRALAHFGVTAEIAVARLTELESKQAQNHAAAHPLCPA